MSLKLKIFAVPVYASMLELNDSDAEVGLLPKFKDLEVPAH